MEASLRKLNLSQNEMSRFTSAMEDPKFRSLLSDYAKEISQPQTHADYEAALSQMEKAQMEIGDLQQNKKDTTTQPPMSKSSKLDTKSEIHCTETTTTKATAKSRIERPTVSLTHIGQFELQTLTHLTANSSHITPQHFASRPQQVQVRIALPRLTSAATIQLDLSERRIQLVESHDAKSDSPYYELDYAMTLAVNPQAGSAKFNKSTHALVLLLPVLAPTRDEIAALQFQLDTQAQQRATRLELQPQPQQNDGASEEQEEEEEEKDASSPEDDAQSQQQQQSHSESNDSNNSVASSSSQYEVSSKIVDPSSQQKLKPSTVAPTVKSISPVKLEVVSQESVDAHSPQGDLSTSSSSSSGNNDSSSSSASSSVVPSPRDVAASTNDVASQSKKSTATEVVPPPQQNKDVATAAPLAAAAVPPPTALLRRKSILKSPQESPQLLGHAIGQRHASMCASSAVTSPQKHVHFTQDTMTDLSKSEIRTEQLTQLPLFTGVGVPPLGASTSPSHSRQSNGTSTGRKHSSSLDQNDAQWPNYTYTQTAQCVTLVLKVKSVASNSCEFEFQHQSFAARFATIYTGSAANLQRTHYALELAHLFAPLDVERCAYEVNSKNVIVRLHKLHATMWTQLCRSDDNHESDATTTVDAPTETQQPQPQAPQHSTRLESTPECEREDSGSSSSTSASTSRESAPAADDGATIESTQDASQSAVAPATAAAADQGPSAAEPSALAAALPAIDPEQMARDLAAAQRVLPAHLAQSLSVPIDASAATNRESNTVGAPTNNRHTSAQALLFELD